MKKSVTCFAIALVALLCVSAISVAFACNGYSQRTYWANEDKVYARISACDCTPRNNYLYASSRAYYESASGNNVWTAWDWDHGYNVSYKSSSVSPAGPVDRGQVHFRHQCITGGSSYKYYDIDVYRSN